MKSFINQNISSIIFLIIIGLIIFVSNYIDKDLSKVLGVAGFFVWFLHEYLKNWLDKDLEKYKHQLQNENIRFKIQYEKLHEDRAEIIREYYQKIVKTTREVKHLTLTLSYEEKGKGKHRYNQLIDKYDNLVNFHEINTLYFENDIQKISKKLFDKLTEIFLIFNFLKYNQQMVKTLKPDIEIGRMSKSEFDQTKKKLVEEMDTSISLLKKELEKKFKKIIGIEEKNQIID